MSEYQKFVKKHLASMKGENMTQQEKMKAVAQMWRESGKSGKGLSMGGGKLVLKGGKATKAKKGGKVKLNMTHYMKEEGGAMLKGGKVKKTKKRTRKGGNIELEETIKLDNGMVLHPSMLGGAWYNDLWKGIKMPFEALGKVAKVVGPVAKMIL